MRSCSSPSAGRSGRRTCGHFSQLVTAGRRIPPERLEEVAHHYELIGGRSPLNELTRGQAERAARGARRRRARAAGLRRHAQLAAVPARDPGRDEGPGLPPGARHHPVVAPDRGLVGALRGGRGRRAREGRPGRARGRLRAALERASAVHRGDGGPRAGGARRRSSPRAGRDARLVFTAHSVPVAMAAGSPYAAQLETAARAVAAALGRSAVVGRLPEPQRHAARSVARARRRRRHPGAGARTARATWWSSRSASSAITSRCSTTSTSRRRRWPSPAGIGFHRAAAANDHPAFIAMLADLVRRGPAS